MPVQTLTPRPDYVKLIVSVDDETLEHWQTRIADAQNETYDFYNLEGGHKDNMLRRTATGRYLWSFEWWGEQATVLYNMPKEWASRYLKRLDVRYEYIGTVAGIKQVGNLIDNGKRRGRNYQRHNSRIRQKRDGRTAGGDGWSLGSHKSEWRASVYKRGEEQAAVEFQVTDKTLLQAVTDTQDMMPETASDYLFWSELCVRVHVRGWMTLEDVTGVPKNQLQVLFRQADGVDETHIEGAMSDIETRLLSMPRDMAEAVVQGVLFHWSEQEHD